MVLGPACHRAVNTYRLNAMRSLCKFQMGLFTGSDEIFQKHPRAHGPAETRTLLERNGGEGCPYDKSGLPRMLSWDRASFCVPLSD